MKKYLIFKPSGIDWLDNIPEGWDVKRLKHISNTRVSNVDKKSEDEIQVKLCNYIDVYKNEFINEKIEFMVATATRRQVDSFELKKGDVIITKDSETPDDIGIPAYVDLEDTKNVVCGYHLAISTPIDSVLLGKYLFRLFQSNIFRSYFEVSSNGITRYGLDTYSILNANIPLPSYSEQCIIADFLDQKTSKIDDLISKKQKLITFLKEERAAIINKAVTKGVDANVEMKDSGVEWLGEIPAHWEVKRLKYVAAFFGGGTPSKGNPAYWSGNIPWVSPKDMKAETIDDAEDHITEDAVENSSTRLIQPGAVLIVVRSGILKHSIPVAINTRTVAINQDMKAVISESFLKPEYLASLISGHQSALLVEWRKTGATVESIEHELLANTPCPIPPLHEQIAIINSLKKETTKIDLIKEKTQKEIDLLKEYRAALISEVVTGKIDVRQEVVS
jgi:type I restriction enzyme, S subunit